jgi:flagellar M-ring protein FliF
MVQEYAAELREKWSDATPLIKGLIIAGGLALVDVLVLLLTSGEPDDDYAVAFSKLELSDASEITALLDEQTTPYRLADDGTTILVPKEQVHQVRLTIAGKGLPKGGEVGFELMDNLQLGSTEFERRVSYVRALQGELVRTIGRLEQVDDVRVHIALPEPSLFVKENSSATAAVFLRLLPGMTLNSEEVRGIKHLVASSIEKLSHQDVTVVDTTGRLLVGESCAEETINSPEDNLALQTEFQNSVEQKLQSLLEQVFGPGQVLVRVNAELNFDKKVVDRELFEPVANEEGLVSSLKQLDESYTGTNAGTAMPSGSDANIPGYQSSAQGDTESEYTRQEVEREYKVNETHEQLVVAPGTVDRMSVAVMVNKELTSAEQASISEVVGAAIGADAQRSDQISVVGMPFDDSLSKKVDKLLEDDKADSQLPIPLPYLAAAGAALLLLVVVFLWFRRRRAQETEEEEAEVTVDGQPVLEQEVSDLAMELQQMGQGRNGSEEIQMHLKRLASKQPENVARVLRTWLDEPE